MRGICIYNTEEAHSLNTYFLSPDHVPGTMLAYEDVAGDSTNRSQASHNPQTSFCCSSVGMIPASRDQAGIKLKLPLGWSLVAPNKNPHPKARVTLAKHTAIWDLILGITGLDIWLLSAHKILFSQGRCSLSKFKKTDTLIFIYLFTYSFIVRSTVMQLGNLHPWVTAQFTPSPQIQLGEKLCQLLYYCHLTSQHSCWLQTMAIYYISQLFGWLGGSAGV